VKTLVLGIGNPILGDDGVGVRVAEALTHRIGDGDIEVRAANTDGLGLLELILGYDRLVIIDAILNVDARAGEVYRLALADVGKGASSVALTHGVNLTTVFEMGRRLFPGEMPREVVIFAVGVKEISQITEEMTAEVGSAVPEVCELILKEVATFT
jgi:hydrogenase maturation protease